MAKVDYANSPWAAAASGWEEADQSRRANEAMDIQKGTFAIAQNQDKRAGEAHLVNMGIQQANLKKMQAEEEMKESYINVTRQARMAGQNAPYSSAYLEKMMDHPGMSAFVQTIDGPEGPEKLIKARHFEYMADLIKKNQELQQIAYKAEYDDYNYMLDKLRMNREASLQAGEPVDQYDKGIAILEKQIQGVIPRLLGPAGSAQMKREEATAAADVRYKDAATQKTQQEIAQMPEELKIKKDEARVKEREVGVHERKQGLDELEFAGKAMGVTGPQAAMAAKYNANKQLVISKGMNDTIDRGISTFRDNWKKQSRDGSISQAQLFDSATAQVMETFKMAGIGIDPRYAAEYTAALLNNLNKNNSKWKPIPSRVFDSPLSDPKKLISTEEAAVQPQEPGANVPLPMQQSHFGTGSSRAINPLRSSRAGE